MIFAADVFPKYGKIRPNALFYKIDYMIVKEIIWTCDYVIIGGVNCS